MNVKLITSILILVISSFAFCSILNNTTKNNRAIIRSIRLRSSFPVFHENEIFNIKDTLLIFYYKDLVLYKIPFFHNYSRTTIDKEGEVVREELIHSELKFQYLIHKQGDSIGLRYDSIDAKSGQIFSVDSFLTTKLVTNIGSFINNNKGKDSLVYTQYDKKRFLLTEKYVPKVKIDASYYDSAILCYSKINNSEFSFSRELDSLKEMKLYRIRFLYNENNRSNDPYLRLPKEFLVEQTDVPVESPKELLLFFEKYKSN
jgi:hypothetical protein